MTLEQKLKTKQVIRRTPDDKILEELAEGKKFIIVENAFDQNYIPQGYTLINMNFKNEFMSVLVPQSLLFYMANPGEGDTDDALDEIASFYGDAEDVESAFMDEGTTSVHQANWSTIARNTYETYIINKLVKGKNIGSDGEPVPEYDSKIIKDLRLDDEYVTQRMKGIAAIMLNKSVDEVKDWSIDQVLKHVTIQKEHTEQLTREEFKEITCWAGSHFEIKDEYRRDPNVSYQIDRMHSKDHMVGTKKVKNLSIAYLDNTINSLEEEIEQYRKSRGDIGLHDKALIREYTNLKYIIKENPNAQLDIMPPEKENDKY